MKLFLGTADSWAGLGWIKNSGLLSWVLVEWASMTIVLYIPYGGFLDFCTIVKYPFPSSNSLHTHRARNSGFPSAVERRTNGRRYVAHPSQKFEAVHTVNHVLGDVVLCFISAESFFVFLPKIQVQWSVKNFTRIILCKRVFWDDMRELFVAYLPHNDMLFFCLETESQTQQNWVQEEILAGHVCELAHRTFLNRWGWYMLLP